jgi:hypothetical protein
LKGEISSIETLLGVNDFIREVDGKREGRKFIVELSFRDDDDGTHVFRAISRLVGYNDLDFVQTPGCRWILHADIGVLLVAAVLTIGN